MCCIPETPALHLFSLAPPAAAPWRTPLARPARPRFPLALQTQFPEQECPPPSSPNNACIPYKDCFRKRIPPAISTTPPGSSLHRELPAPALLRQKSTPPLVPFPIFSKKAPLPSQFPRSHPRSRSHLDCPSPGPQYALTRPCRGSTPLLCPAVPRTSCPAKRLSPRNAHGPGACS